MLECEKCGAVAFVIESRRNSSGNVRRRFHCKTCNYRWTEWNGEAPPSAAPKVRLSDEIILDILTNRLSEPVLAERHGCSMAAVGKIRRGELHASVHPEIPRFKTRSKPACISCRECFYYTGADKKPCDLGHKDPAEEGLTFAAYCSNFIMNSFQK